MASNTALERFGLTVGSNAVDLSLFAIYALILGLTLLGYATLSRTRLLLYLMGGVVACISYWLNAWANPSMPPSVASLVLLLVLYFPCTLVIKENRQSFPIAQFAIDAYLSATFICAIAGIAQFFLQFVIHNPLLFNFTPLIPPSLRSGTNVNTVIQAGRFVKSNGFFMREPSGFSLSMSLGLQLEYSERRRTRRIVCYALGLLLSYSGTGLLALILGSMFPVNLKVLRRFIVLGLTGVVIFVLLSPFLDLSFTLNRITEFNNQGTSAHARYLAPFGVLAATYDDTPWALAIGHGPGAMTRAIATTFYSHDPTWAKLLHEYGVAGFVLFVSLAITTLNNRHLALSVRATLFFGWLIMGGHLLSPVMSAPLMVTLAGLSPRGSDRGQSNRPSVLRYPSNVGFSRP